MGTTLGPQDEPQMNDDATSEGGPAGDFQKMVAWASKIGGLLKMTASQRTSLTSSQTRVGWLIVETDTGNIYLRTAEAPQGIPIHIADTGWQDITLNPGWSTYLGETPKWRVKNGILQLAGRASAGPTATGEITTLPAVARHTSSLMIFRLHYDNGVAGVTVGFNGVVAVFEPSAAASRPGISLSQVQYIVG